MENSNPELAELPREQPEAASNNEASVLNSNDTFSVAKDDKGSDSDANSEELNCNEEQSNLNNGNSQFYESSDSKIDYAVKIDDNDTLSDIEDIKTDSASADSEDSALGSLPPDGALTDREEEAPDRSDGSDSGLGSETNEDAKLPNCSLNAPCTSDNNNLGTCNVAEHNENAIEIDEKEVPDNPQVIPVEKKALKSSLKRKREEETVEEPIAKKKKENIRFDNVTVYYFPRVQGFTCVPSQGGSTLGMEWEHSHIQHFTLAEHALEQRRLHRQILQQLKSDRHSLQGAVLSSSEDSDTEEETSDISESELDLDSYFFLQPVPTRQRRALLRAAGVRKIEGYEKDECRDIRTSRELCGCACKGVCNPESCSCSASGIKCQVDRLNFPCGCSRDGCGNTTGRIEFNPIRVRTHFIHTLMRLGLQKKNEEHPDVVKRQWAEAHHNNPSPCMANTLYERDQRHVQDDGLLRDVNLTPRIEVESCVNAGSFNNVHCDLNTPSIQGNVQKDIPYGYRNDTAVTPNHMNINENNIHFENTNNHHVSPYTSNILQGKGPPYSVGNTMGFNTMTNDMQRFPCDLNYAYEHHTDNHHFKGLQSFSATRFEEFAHNSQMSMFSHYGHVYVPDYMHKPSTTMHDHNAVQYHAMPQSHYAMYKNNAECASVDANKQTNDSHYTTLMTLPYQNSNKSQTVENDENWFSHSTLMNVDHYDHSTQDAPEVPPAPAQPPPAPDAASSEPTENFGELIKKTMVESVTV